MQDITDFDHRHAKRVFKNLSNENLSIIIICMSKVITYYLQMYLKILGTNLLKYMN